MRSTTSPVVTLAFLLLGFALLQMGNGMQSTLLAIRAGIESFSATSTGLIMSGYYVGMCIGSFSASRLIAQAGHIRVFAALASLGSAAALVHLLVIDPLVWITVRTVTGFCFAGLIITVESWLNASSTAASRGRVLSVYAMCSMGANIVGQLILSTADPATFTLFVVVSILMSLALVPISLSRASAPVSDGPQGRPSVRKLWAYSPFGAVAVLLIGASFGAFFGLTPLYAQQIGIPQGQIAYVMASFLAGGLLMQYPIGMLSDRFNRRKVVIVTTGFASLILLIMALMGAMPLWALLSCYVLAGGLILPSHSVVIAHVNDRAPATAMITVAGGLVLMLGMGAATGPVLAGFVMEWLGPTSLLCFIAFLQASICAYGIVRIYLVEDPKAESKTGFTATPIQPIAAELKMQVYEDAAKSERDAL
jgi:MFS family permease